MTASKVKLKTYIGEVLDVLGDVQCSIVSKGKRYYLPILVGDYYGKLTVSCFVQTGCGSLLYVAHYCMLEWGEVFCFPKGNPVRSDSHLNDLLSKL